MKQLIQLIAGFGLLVTMGTESIGADQSMDAGFDDLVRIADVRPIPGPGGLVEINYEFAEPIVAPLGNLLITEVLVKDLDRHTQVTAKTFASTPTYEAGRHHLVWSAQTDGVAIPSENSVAELRVVSKPATYCVIDLSGGTKASSFAVTYLENIPSGGWTYDHKTTKLAMRRIKAGTDPRCRYRLTKDFWVGVFEVTQKQWELMGGDPKCMRGTYGQGDDHPVYNVEWVVLRGHREGAKWPNSRAVDPWSIFGVLRKKTGIPTLDLPTEAQWEYACRAGTVSRFSYGVLADLDYMWCKENSYWGTRSVGGRKPNPWGLYDMHGNVWEWCLDIHGSTLQGNDPVGVGMPLDTDPRAVSRRFRGGSCEDPANECTSSQHLSTRGYFHTTGFRLFWTQP